MSGSHDWWRALPGELGGRADQGRGRQLQPRKPRGPTCHRRSGPHGSSAPAAARQTRPAPVRLARSWRTCPRRAGHLARLAARRGPCPRLPGRGRQPFAHARQRAVRDRGAPGTGRCAQDGRCRCWNRAAGDPDPQRRDASPVGGLPTRLPAGGQRHLHHLEARAGHGRRNHDETR